MTPRDKAKLIDKYNDEFINTGRKDQERAYNKYFTNVLGKVTQERKEPITRKEVRKVVNDTPIDTSPFKIQIYSSLILSGVSNVIEKQKLDKDDLLVLAPIMLILSFYNNNPKIVADKTQVMTKAFVTNNDRHLTDRDKKIFVQYKKYYTNNVNRSTLKTLIKDSNLRIKQINNDIKSNTTKSIQKSLRKEINTQIIEKVRVKDGYSERSRFQTYDEIRKKLRNKFGKELDYRVRRIVDTELKEIQERTKTMQHSMLGYTHKKWNTQLDTAVRKSHRLLQNKTIPIDKKFKVGKGRGMYPGDPSLPIGERINERCYLTYIKRK